MVELNSTRLAPKRAFSFEFLIRQIDSSVRQFCDCNQSMDELLDFHSDSHIISVFQIFGPSYHLWIIIVDAKNLVPLESFL